MILPESDKQYIGTPRNGEDIASYDHLLPRCKGGQGGFNLVIAHRGCNSKRGDHAPTSDELERLGALNEKRQHLISTEHGRISASSFGEITSSSIVLAEVLNAYEGQEAARQRSLSCRFMDRFCRDMRALDDVRDINDWQRLSHIIRELYLDRLNESKIDQKDFVANVVHSIVKNRMERRRLQSSVGENFGDISGDDGLTA